MNCFCLFLEPSSGFTEAEGTTNGGNNPKRPRWGDSITWQNAALSRWTQGLIIPCGQQKCSLLTHWGSVTHICITNLGHRWLRWLAAWPVPNLYLNQCWNIVYWTLGNKRNWNLYIFIKKRHLKNAVWEMSAILSQQRVDKGPGPACRCPGSLHHKVISSYGIGLYKWAGPCILWGFHITTAYLSKNDIWYKYLLMFIQNNSKHRTDTVFWACMHNPHHFLDRYCCV